MVQQHSKQKTLRESQGLDTSFPFCCGLPFKMNRSIPTCSWLFFLTLLDICMGKKVHVCAFFSFSFPILVLVICSPRPPVAWSCWPGSVGTGLTLVHNATKGPCKTGSRSGVWPPDPWPSNNLVNDCGDQIHWLSSASITGLTGVQSHTGRECANTFSPSPSSPQRASP